jgi:hypothetical protein
MMQAKQFPFFRYISLCAASAALIFSFSETYWKMEFYMSDWLRHQFFINYLDLGFVKRGLIGTILYPFPSLLTREGITYFSFAFAMVSVALFWWYFFCKTTQLSIRSQLILALCALLGPGFIMHIGTDIGRFDWIGLLALVSSLVAVEKRQLILASLINMLGILSHEACFVAFLPLVIVYELHIQVVNKQINLPNFGRLLVFPCLALIAITLFGLPEANSPTDVRNLLLTKNHAFQLIQLRDKWWDDPLYVITRSFKDNFEWTVRTYYSAEATYANRRIWIFAGLLWLIGYILVFIYYLRINDINIPWYSVAAISPVSMILIAIDFPRMLSLATITVFIMFILLLNKSSNSKSIYIPVWPAIFIIATGVLLGPFGDVWLFPGTLTPRNF